MKWVLRKADTYQTHVVKASVTRAGLLLTLLRDWEWWSSVGLRSQTNNKLTPTTAQSVTWIWVVTHTCQGGKGQTCTDIGGTFEQEMGRCFIVTDTSYISMTWTLQMTQATFHPFWMATHRFTPLICFCMGYLRLRKQTRQPPLTDIQHSKQPTYVLQCSLILSFKKWTPFHCGVLHILQFKRKLQMV